MADRKDRQELLDVIRKKLAAESFGGGGNYWKAKAGRNVIRILPGVGEMGDFFWQDVGAHYVKSRNRPFTCRQFTIGEPCPICELVNDLYNAGDADSKELASQLLRRKSYWMNIIDRSNEEAGPQIYTPGAMVFKAVAGLVGDPDYGDIYDEYDGMDIIVTRTGTGLETRYDVNARPKRTPLACIVDNRGRETGEPDEDLLDKWLEAAVDLTPMELSDDPSEDVDAGADVVVTVLPYDRLNQEFAQLDTSGSDEKDVPFPDDEGDIRDVIRKKRGSRRSRRSQS